MSPVATCIVIVGGLVWTPDGVVEDRNVVVRDGRIAEVSTEQPPDCETIDASRRFVTPGLIDVWTDLGVSQVGLEAFTVDTVPHGREKTKPASVNAAFQLADAYDPRSPVIPVQRIAGLTSALLVPGGGLISGQSAWADLAGGTRAAGLKRRSAGMHARLGGADFSRAMAFARLRDAFQEAERYRTRKDDWEKARAREPRFGARDLEALIPVLDGKLPFVVHADRAADIEALLRLQEELGLRLVIAGGAEAWLHADLLARRKVPVILDPLVYGPKSFDQTWATRENPSRLAKAGVKVVLSAFWGHNARTLPQVAGNAIREGLSRADAMKAITQNPADAFQMPDHGRIQRGAVANLVVWSGDPFELSSAPEHVLIGGRPIRLESRQTHLRRRYLEGDGTGIPEPLSLP